MADRQVVLFAPLCFLLTKFDKLDIKRIKTALVDFYLSEEITAAKERLVKDAQALSLDGMPIIGRRRNSDNRYQRECDDMVEIITFLDEGKFLSLFPHYAFDCSDHFLSAHLDEGYMRLLLRKLDNMQVELMATGKLVQRAEQCKLKFGQMLDKVHPPLKMTLRTVGPVIPKQLQGAVGERPSTDCDSDQTTLGAQPAPTLAANRQDVLTQGTRPAPSTKRDNVVNSQSLLQPTHWASRTSLSDDNSQLDVDRDPGDPINC